MKAEDNKPESVVQTARQRVPWWMYVVIVLCAMPGLAFPFAAPLLISNNLDIRGLAWFYPVYVLASAIITWQCYGRRTYLCWIILALMLISHAAFFYLAYTLGAPAPLR